MTIEQTVEIPGGHRLVIEVPPEIPAGMAGPASAGYFLNRLHGYPYCPPNPLRMG
jgi:hypothetical protein